jgi:S1-C subfamily serine protease
MIDTNPATPPPIPPPGSRFGNPLASLSDAIEARVAAGAGAVAALGWGGPRHISAIVWRPGVLVTSEQSLPRGGAYTARLSGGQPQAATLAGRDPTTNVAVLRIEGGGGSSAPAAPRGGGALVIALGADGQGGTTARLGPVETVGPAWDSQAGGRIDHLIRLGIRLAPAAEGGPVFDAQAEPQAGLLGMSTFGPRRSVLVIPAATIARVAEALLLHGRIVRGWLGVVLHQVALPRDLHARAGAASGLMVLSLAENAPAAAMLMQGDILLALNDIPLTSPRATAASLGPDAIGRSVTLRVLRGGALVTVDITVAARPA